jgi:hypothetical protein
VISWLIELGVRGSALVTGLRPPASFITSAIVCFGWVPILFLGIFASATASGARRRMTVAIVAVLCALPLLPGVLYFAGYQKWRFTPGVDEGGGMRGSASGWLAIEVLLIALGFGWVSFVAFRRLTLWLWRGSDPEEIIFEGPDVHL